MSDRTDKEIVEYWKENRLSVVGNSGRLSRLVNALADGFIGFSPDNQESLRQKLQAIKDEAQAVFGSLKWRESTEPHGEPQRNFIAMVVTEAEELLKLRVS